jgi:esterase/lipase superfamily enzyme
LQSHPCPYSSNQYRAPSKPKCSAHTPKYWRISDRAIRSGQPSSTEQGPLSYWTADNLANDGTIAWQKISTNQFQTQLKGAANALNPNNNAQQEDQPHVTFFVHGFNVGWQAASESYLNLCNRLFSSDKSMGLCVSFDWPSFGDVLGYYPAAISTGQKTAISWPKDPGPWARCAKSDRGSGASPGG